MVITKQYELILQNKLEPTIVTSIAEYARVLTFNKANVHNVALKEGITKDFMFMIGGSFMEHYAEIIKTLIKNNEIKKGDVRSIQERMRC